MAIGTAKNLGVEDFWFITKSKGMLRRCKQLGVEVSKDPYYLIMPLKVDKDDKRTELRGTNLLEQINRKNGEK